MQVRPETETTTTARTADPGDDGDDGDGAVLARVGAGDLTALALLYARYARRLVTVAERIVHEHPVAEDLVHDVFVGLHHRAVRFEPARGSVITWLSTMTRHKAIDVARRQKRVVRLHARLEAEPSPRGASHETTSAPDGRAVRDALTFLPTEQRQVLEAAYFDGLTFAEIAHRHGWPIGTVKSRAARGLSSLRERLAPTTHARSLLRVEHDDALGLVPA